MLAFDVVRLVGEILGVLGVLEVTVEGISELDMSELDNRKHAGVILDGVGDALMLKQNREALQGRPKECRGGKSATMVYSYGFSLFKRAVVATFDLSAQNLALFEEDHWLSNEQNVIVLRLDAPAWIGGLPSTSSALAAPVPLSREDRMRQWSVLDVVKFCTEQDMLAAASMVKQNDVSGADFFKLSEEDCMDMRATPFLAKKILRARDAYLTA